ncbi:GNAT family N-acetyltransferase [Roseibium sp. TrichSKD4]|uniref:GNAT family N-acetyltransferase n=1 Tax=Roseibium sp. TrichSKD4 TaxID=744980 RepID=UPI00058E488C|nr:GNAT family N-acetyltransferase [Roseibium sp. TrichSKD4]
MSIEIRVLTGSDLVKNLPKLAELRINVFKDWPYLYEGSLEYEEKYLARYAKTDGAVIVGAFDDGDLVGAATGEPLDKEVIQFRKPFEDLGFSPSRIFYLAESVLDSKYRGRGIGHRFFDEREAHAKRLGYSQTAFCSVVRSLDHPAQPADYRPLDPFWKKRGYDVVDGLIVHFPWQDVGDQQETEKPMQVWMRDLL